MAPCEYVALSYVWGPEDSFGLRTTKDNLNTLRTHHAFESTTHNACGMIPRTISDAMELCKAIDYRYLWVDRLCIVQDDEAEKQRLIHGMNYVYENASLNVIAACGQNAGAGLAGIAARQNHTYMKRYEVQLGDASLPVSIAPISLEEQVRKSHWNTRAWTLQEQSLSTRRLYFTADEVFFECPSKMLRESYATEELAECVVRKGPPFWGRALRMGVNVPLVSVTSRGSKQPWNIAMYAAVVSSYSRRNLSYPEDILNAFSGIYQRCTSAQPTPLPITAVQGLNSASFAHSLLWFIAEYDKSRITRREVAHGYKLSGWSWASWSAPVDFICVHDSSFPAPTGERFHDLHTPKIFFFVSEWTVISKNDNGTNRFTIFEDSQSFSIGHWHFLRMQPEHILAPLSTKPSFRELNDTMGSLNFMAPCITISLHSRLIVDPKISDGGHLLMLPEIEEHFGIIKFDSDDQCFTEFALVLFDGCYVALCIRTEGLISRRIGVSQLSQWKPDWQAALDGGSLRLEWKQICLV